MTPVSVTHAPAILCLNRFHEMEQKVGDFQKRLGITHPVNLKISSFHKSPRAQSDKHIVKIPSWFLFHYDDIPERFRIADCQDAKYYNEAFLLEMAAWMNGKLVAAGFRHRCQPVNLGALQRMLTLLSDRNLYERAKNFILGHELSHVLQGEINRDAFRSQLLRGALVFFLSCALIPLLGAAFSTSVAALGALACSAGGLYYFYRSFDPIPFNAIASEKDADLRSVQMLGDAVGGIYYFQMSLLNNLLICLHNPQLRNEYDGKGNNLKDKSHPLLTDRVTYLQTHLPPGGGRCL